MESYANPHCTKKESFAVTAFSWSARRPSASASKRVAISGASDRSRSSQLFFTQLSKDIFIAYDEEFFLCQYVLQKIAPEFRLKLFDGINRRVDLTIQC